MYLHRTPRLRNSSRIHFRIQNLHFSLIIIAAEILRHSWPASTRFPCLSFVSFSFELNFPSLPRTQHHQEGDLPACAIDWRLKVECWPHTVLLRYRNNAVFTKNRCLARRTDESSVKGRAQNRNFCPICAGTLEFQINFLCYQLCRLCRHINGHKSFPLEGCAGT